MGGAHPTHKKTGTRLTPRRRGFTYLESVVSLVLLGLALAGVCPIVVMQVKLSSRLARGSNPQTSYFGPTNAADASPPTFYLVPSADRWERKLGVASALRTDTASTSGASTSTPDYDVTVVSPPEKSLGSENVVIHVLVVPHPEH